MNNCEKLLRAFIEAQGYEIEEVSAIRDGEVIPDSVCYYKVTKKLTPVNAIESLRHVIELNEHRMNNARLCFYSFETYQPKDSFLDKRERMLHAQPIIADCKGKFSDIWLKKPYKVVLSDSRGEDIFEKNYHEEI